MNQWTSHRPHYTCYMPKPHLALIANLTAAPADGLPQLVAVGAIRLHAGEPTPQVPLALPVGGDMPGSAGLCVRASGSVQQVADLQQAVAVRLACGLVPELLRVHAVDLIGVGSCYPWLGALPQGVFGKQELITDSRALTTLLLRLLDEAKARNLEKLAHRYRTLRDYNAVTQEQEPLHLLLLSSYPAQWTEEQLGLLRQLITLAPRTGHWIMVHHEPALRTAGMADMTELARDVLSPLATVEWVPSTRRYALTGTPVADTFHQDWELLPDGLGLPLPVQQMDAALTSLKEKAAEMPRHSGIRVPIGTKGGHPFYLELADQTTSALVGGAPGSGKSVLLHNIVLGIIEHYSPQEVQLVLMDLKDGMEFAVYHGHPSVQHFLHGADAGKGVEALEKIEAARAARGELFRERGVNSIARWNEAFPSEPMPRIVVVVDEFQRLFEASFKEKNQINDLLAKLARLGRSVGIHLIMASQSLTNSFFDNATRNCFSLRIVLRIAASECSHFLGDLINVAPSHFDKPGRAIYNPLNGVMAANQEIRVTPLELAEVKARLRDRK